MTFKSDRDTCIYRDQRHYHQCMRGKKVCNFKACIDKVIRDD